MATLVAPVAGRELFRLMAPRLERAHRQRREEIRVLHVRRRIVLSQILDQERLVAHRELQLLRAGATQDRRYLARRQHKLDRAKGELETLERRRKRIETELRCR